MILCGLYPVKMAYDHQVIVWYRPAVCFLNKSIKMARLVRSVVIDQSLGAAIGWGR